MERIEFNEVEEKFQNVMKGAAIESIRYELDTDEDEWMIVKFSNEYEFHIPRMVIVHPQVH